MPRFRALVLAAGRGERLRPLSDALPKPLLPVAGRPVAAHTLERLRRAGCESAALNLHHLGDDIRRALGEEWAGMPLRYSPEATLLGTLGALYPLREFLADAEAVVLLNGDSFCRWPLEALVRHHLRSGAAATLLLVKRAPAEELRRGVLIDRAGRVAGFRDAVPRQVEPAALRRRVFGGAHVLSPELLGRVPEGPGDIIAGLYDPLLREGAAIATVTTGRRWHDLGKPRRYLHAALEAGLNWWLGGRSRVAESASVERGARLLQTVVEDGGRVEAGARLERTLVLAGGRVGANARLRETIVGPAAVVPAGTVVERRLITARGPHAPLPAASMVGNLVFTPLD